jgi:hypothetical protein
LFPSTALWKVFPLASIVFLCLVLFIKWAEHRLNPWVLFIHVITAFLHGSWSGSAYLTEPNWIRLFHCFGLHDHSASNCHGLHVRMGHLFPVGHSQWSYSVFLSCLLIAGLFTVYTVFMIG